MFVQCLEYLYIGALFNIYKIGICERQINLKRDEKLNTSEWPKLYTPTLSNKYRGTVGNYGAPNSEQMESIK